MTITQTAPRTHSSKTTKQWKLLEMVHLSDDPTDVDAGAPLQWLKLDGQDPEAQAPIIVLGGFQGASQNDNRVMQLMQKALSSGIIDSCSDIYLCPIVNPSSRSSSSYLNKDGVDIMNSFPVGDATKAVPMETRSIMNWIERLEPKAVVTLDSGCDLINQNGVMDELLEKISALAEREVLAIGETPKTEEEEEPVLNALGIPVNSEGSPVVEESKGPSRAIENNIGKWCEERDLIWINFSVTSEKRSFDEIREDWRLNIGPAMKWLFEGPRFNPPEQEPEIESPTVVPTLDLPPELMNL